ncbi:transposase, partial [Microbacterium paraoxydans]
EQQLALLILGDLDPYPPNLTRRASPPPNVRRAWMGLLAHPTGEARKWEPKRLRLRLFSIPAAIAHTGRRVILHFSDRARWAEIAIAAISRLRALPPAPG